MFKALLLEKTDAGCTVGVKSVADAVRALMKSRSRGRVVRHI